MSIFFAKTVTLQNVLESGNHNHLVAYFTVVQKWSQWQPYDCSARWRLNSAFQLL